MGNTAKAKKPAVKKKVTSGKDKALMSIIRDCDQNPWCAHSMSISADKITYQKPHKGVTFLALLNEVVSADVFTDTVEVEL